MISKETLCPTHECPNNFERPAAYLFGIVFASGQNNGIELPRWALATTKHKKSLSYQPRLKGHLSANGSLSTLAELKRGKVKKGWLKKVWGKWPGDEPIADLLAALTK